MKSSTIFALIILATMGLVIIMSLGYPYSAKNFPILVAIPVAALTGVQIVREVRAQAEPKGEPHEPEASRKDTFRKHLAAPAWMAALLLIIYSAGLLVGCPLFTFLYLRLHRQGWLLSINVSLVILAVLYGGFVVGLQISLYRGLLIELFM
jgi:hypothetical protein